MYFKLIFCILYLLKTWWSTEFGSSYNLEHFVTDKKTWRLKARPGHHTTDGLSLCSQPDPVLARTPCSLHLLASAPLVLLRSPACQSAEVPMWSDLAADHSFMMYSFHLICSTNESGSRHSHLTGNDIEVLRDGMTVYQTAGRLRTWSQTQVSCFRGHPCPMAACLANCCRDQAWQCP